MHQSAMSSVDCLETRASLKHFKLMTSSQKKTYLVIMDFAVLRYSKDDFLAEFSFCAKAFKAAQQRPLIVF